MRDDDLPPGRITLPEMQEALSRSGYPMEQRAEQFLRHQQFIVLTNPAFHDPSTGKLREYDLKAWTWATYDCDEWGSIFVQPVLMFECKNNLQPIVFFSADPFIRSDIMHQRYSGYPLKFVYGDDWTSLERAIGLGKNHHWTRWPLSTQWCTFQQKRGSDQWFAFHDEDHYGAFHGLIQAVESEIQQHYLSIANAEWDITHPHIEHSIQVYYPVVMFSGPIYSASIHGDEVVVHRIDHIAFIRHLITGHEKQNESYTIDVISEDYLPEYVKEISEDAQGLVAGLSVNAEKVKMSMNRLMDSLRQVPQGSLAEYRKILEL